MKNTDIREADWQEFERTGSVRSYLKYKGIETKKYSAAKISGQSEDGEIIGTH